MNNLVTFNFRNNELRTEVIDGEPWFCLLDCRAALGIKGSLKKVSLSEKGVRKTYTLTAGGKQEVNYINEPNLYRLIFRSNKPQAQAFADWVYSEVLPSIRKTGGYGAPAPAAVDMKAIGGTVKRCAAAAIRKELETLSMQDDKAMMGMVGTLIDYIVNERVKHELRERLNKVSALLAE